MTKFFKKKKKKRKLLLAGGYRGAEVGERCGSKRALRNQSWWEGKCPVHDCTIVDMLVLMLYYHFAKY